MPDDFDASRGMEVAQRGFPRGGFPRGGGMRRGFPRGRGGFPGRFPIRRRFPIFPFFFGFPQQRCFFIDQWGRCCDQWGRCCDRWGRCSYPGFGPYAGTGQDSWYGVPGSWDMMADMDDGYDDMGSVVAYIDDDFD